MKLKLAMHAKDISLYMIFFYFGRIRTVVAMATSIFHRLIMGKVKIGNFSVSMGIFGIHFYKKYLLSSPLCFIWLLSK